MQSAITLNLSLVTSAFVCCYGIVFAHLAALVLVLRKKAAVHYAYAAFLLDFSLMCLIGGYGVSQDRPSDFSYAGTFVFMVFLTPLAAFYILEFLGDSGRRRLVLTAAASAAVTLVLGLFLGARGLSWHKVFCLAYVQIFLTMLIVGLIEQNSIAPFRFLSKELKKFFLAFWGVALQILLLLVFQFFEVSNVVHALWMITTAIIIAHNLLVTRDPDIYIRYKEITEIERQGKSRLGNVNVHAQLALLQRVMAEKELYKTPNLQLEDLASALRLSAPQLSELLNRYLGKGFPAYINQLRVDEAKRQLLARPDLGILDICYDCGFSSKSSFNAVFRKATDLTPSEYRSRSSVGISINNN